MYTTPNNIERLNTTVISIKTVRHNEEWRIAMEKTDIFTSEDRHDNNQQDEIQDDRKCTKH